MQSEYSMTIEANDIFDILLLSYIHAYSFLKGTEDMQVLWGFCSFDSLCKRTIFWTFSIVWLLDVFCILCLGDHYSLQEDILKGLAKAGSLFPSIRKSAYLSLKRSTSLLCSQKDVSVHWSLSKEQHHWENSSKTQPSWMHSSRSTALNFATQSFA